MKQREDNQYKSKFVVQQSPRGIRTFYARQQDDARYYCRQKKQRQG